MYSAYSPMLEPIFSLANGKKRMEFFKYFNIIPMEMGLNLFSVKKIFLTKLKMIITMLRLTFLINPRAKIVIFS